LNPVASLVVELIDGGRGLDQIRDILLPLVGRSGWDACRAWIERAVGDGWLTADVEPSGSSRFLSAETLSALATSLRDRDQVLAAFICQQRAAELAPCDAQMWYRLGELAHIVGRRDEARAAYERYFEQHAEDAEVAHLLIALRDAAPPARMSDHAIRQLYARFAPFYDDNMTGDLEYRAPFLLQRAIAAALGDRRDLAILDLGCGTGLSGQALRPLARRLTGVDLSPAMIDRARARGVYDGLHVAEITAFLRTEAAAGGDVDLIASCDALIYFGDLRQVVVPAALRLVRGGLLAITVERGDAHPWTLADSGRFTHHREHLVQAAAAARLSVVSVEDAVLRHEYGNPVQGLIAVFAR
jgi:predicted TPR repeat methyltransferase